MIKVPRELIPLGLLFNDASISSSNLTTSDFPALSGSYASVTAVTGKKLILGALIFYTISSMTVKTLSGWGSYSGCSACKIDGCIPVIASSSYLTTKTYTTTIKDSTGAYLKADLQYNTYNSYGTWSWMVYLSEPSGWNSVSANQTYTLSNMGTKFVVHKVS